MSGLYKYQRMIKNRLLFCYFSLLLLPVVSAISLLLMGESSGKRIFACCLFASVCLSFFVVKLPHINRNCIIYKCAKLSLTVICHSHFVKSH